MLALVGIPARARADDLDRQACIEAYVNAQTARKDGELLRARRSLSACARDGCPGMIKRDCISWTGEVDALIPSLVLAAEDDHGHPLPDARASIDGVSAPINGAPVTLDAGRHSIRFEHGGDAPQERTIVLAERERGRRVTAVFPVKVPRSTPVPVPVYVLGALGIASLGGGSYFAIRGISDRSSLGCDRGCSSSDYQRVNGEFVAADVGIAVGVVALGVGLAVWIFARDHDARAAAVTRDQWPSAAW